MRLADVEQAYIQETTPDAVPSNERVIETPDGFRINPAYLQQIVSDNREALAILAENDGPVVDEHNEASR